MSAVTTKPRTAAAETKIALQAPPGRLNTEEADFIRGRDLAINMLDEAEALMGEREGLRWMRGGNAQDNLVKGYLADVIADPKLMNGFTSILSTTIRNDHMDLDCLREITLAETQAGAIGADGTQTGQAATDAASEKEASHG